MSAMKREALLWQKLVAEAGEELIEEAASVSVAQAEKDLAEAGFDVAAERARAEAFLASLEGVAAAEEAVAQAVPQEAPASLPERVAKGERKKPRPAGVWVAAAAAAVAAGAAVTYVATHPGEAPTTSPTTPPSTGTAAPSLAAAADLRRSAAAACEEGRADACVSLLDQAAAVDPAGDTAPEVQRLRKKAAAIEMKPKPR
jgi:hypothetical protein